MNFRNRHRFAFDKVATSASLRLLESPLPQSDRPGSRRARGASITAAGLAKGGGHAGREKSQQLHALAATLKALT